MYTNTPTHLMVCVILIVKHIGHTKCSMTFQHMSMIFCHSRVTWYLVILHCNHCFAKHSWCLAKQTEWPASLLCFGNCRWNRFFVPGHFAHRILTDQEDILPINANISRNFIGD